MTVLPMKAAFRALIFGLLLAMAVMPVHAASESPSPVSTRQQKQIYSGNVDSRIYHNSGCRYFTCKKCTASFASADEARSRGFRACKVCGGEIPMRRIRDTEYCAPNADSRKKAAERTRNFLK